MREAKVLPVPPIIPLIPRGGGGGRGILAVELQGSTAAVCPERPWPQMPGERGSLTLTIPHRRAAVYGKHRHLRETLRRGGAYLYFNALSYLRQVQPSLLANCCCLW